MSGDDNEDSVLGKRAMEEDDSGDDVGPMPPPKADGNGDDESDDDIGPMPVPDGAGKARKKRKGEFNCFCC